MLLGLQLRRCERKRLGKRHSERLVAERARRSGSESVFLVVRKPLQAEKECRLHFETQILAIHKHLPLSFMIQWFRVQIAAEVKIFCQTIKSTRWWSLIKSGWGAKRSESPSNGRQTAVQPVLGAADSLLTQQLLTRQLQVEVQRSPRNLFWS